AIAREAGGSIPVLAPSLPGLAACLASCEAVVANDSGPLHLASLTDTPLVALYGPNIPEVSGPWRRTQVTLLQQDLDCRPCSQRGCDYDTMRCMKNITVDETYEAIIRYLQ
ncbi:MAG: lipopolysaccharide heptosyltransferase II, partial [Dehalococcoidia bacterium]